MKKHHTFSRLSEIDDETQPQSTGSKIEKRGIIVGNRTARMS